MLWILPDWLCFYLGFFTVLLTIVQLILRFIKPPYNLQKRYGGGWAVVTGGSDGIGLGFCQQLAKLGFNICIVGRNKSKISDVCAKLEQLNNKIKTKIVIADFVNSHESNFFNKIVKEIQDIDVSILVNNVGVLTDVGLYQQNNAKDIQKQTKINMLPVSILTRLMLPKFLERPYKSGIINLSSYSTLFRLKNSVNYCSTKSFIDIFSRSLEYQYGDKIDFLSLKPCLVTTQMARNVDSLLHVSKNSCARGALKSLGRYSIYAGAWWHQLQSFATQLVPDTFRDYMIGNAWTKIGEKYKQIDKKKQKNI